MATFRLRSWETQTLYDARDYEVVAATLEAAAELLDELQERAQETCGPVDLPPEVSSVDGNDGEMRVLDPEEIVGSERGIAEIDPAGRKLRDVTPTVADAPGDTAAKVLAAFIADIEAVGVETVRQDWPDLIVTYERARAALAATLVG